VHEFIRNVGDNMRQYSAETFVGDLGEICLNAVGVSIAERAPTQ
jgi:hypothetical protein